MAEIKSRPIGKALFGVNFEPTGQAPLDARLVVENMETLLANETYVDRGNNFYEGMPVIVKQGKSGKSELWVLIDGTKVTDKAGWRRLDADGAAINVNIEEAINGLDSTVSAEGTHVDVEVVETDGILTEITVTEKDIASATELSNTIKKIGTGFDATNTVAKAISDEASNRDEAIANAINNLNNTDIEEDGQFVTKVSESSGIITVTRQTVAADKVTATAITASDTTVAVAGNNVADQIASLGTTIKTVEGNAAKYKVVKLSAEEVSALSDANVKEAYKVVSYIGAETGSTVYTKVGEVIKIYKDANLESAELGTGENAQKLILTYILADGTRKSVPIDFKAIAFESEFKDGLAVAPNGEISVKRDVASEDFLTVSTDGVKLDGVQDAIDAAVAAKNVTAEGDEYITATASDNKVSVSADVQPLTVTSSAGGSTITGTRLSLVDGAEVADKVSNFTNARISEEIAKLDVSDIGEEGKFITKVSEVDGKIAAEFAQVKANEVKLEQIGEVDANGIKLNATTVQEGIAELFTKILDNEEVDAEAINKIKTIFGITGEELKYEAKSDNTIIGNATSYSDADVKLAEAFNKIKTILGITGEELKYETKSDDTIIGTATSYSDADVKLAEAIRTAQGNTITIQAGNGVNITSSDSEKTINIKVVNDDKLITVDNSGIHTKDNAVFDCGVYYFSCKKIDLGLPSGTLWADRNIGATDIYDGGKLFQWGDPTPYDIPEHTNGNINEGQKMFKWNDYKWNPSGDGSTFTKYNQTDGKTTLDLEDDAAYVNMGNTWKMPTQEQVNELFNETTQELYAKLTDGSEPVKVANGVYNNRYYGYVDWTYINGHTSNEVSGKLAYMVLTSKTNSNFLVVPSSADALDGRVDPVGQGGRFWSSSLVSQGSQNAWRGYYYHGNYGTYYRYRYQSLGVRGVVAQ